jgi:hypothetical protein
MVLSAMIQTAPTDAERLAFELNHVTDKDFDLKTGEHWIKYSVAIKNVMEHHVARGKSWVECIDNAIRATRKIQAAIEEEDHADSGK